MTITTLDIVGVVVLVSLDLYMIADLIVDMVRWRRSQREKASEALLQIAIDSFIPCPEEACGDCGQETYGEDHACAYLTTLDVACIRRS